MKKFLATTAVMLIATTGAASAQSVLERVLTSLDAATSTELNGTFANIAENLGGAGMTTVYAAPDGTVLTADEYQAGLDSAVAAAVAAITVVAEPNPANYNMADATELAAYGTAVEAYNTYVGEVAAATTGATNAYTGSYIANDVAVAGLGGIDGSITNTIEGVTSAIAEASQSATAGLDTVAYEFNLPTYDLGALSTTALGAVNTGDITLGVNSTVDDAKTTSTQAVSSVMQQLGGTIDNGALVLNIASNMTGVNGSITNSMNNVNGVLASASTTALGAVNTGTITSGVNAAVQGIVGTSGQSGL
ncbi:hypothetical protein [Celeribacter baekdonensis]|jgi:hypothetical protein|uniref:Uncharacterized protein n=1 Tax=Celeribacter baekdonensis B30 TaxID=1208323 RepID=K2J150_9RHOB|nr:hypothetical protein [Celeribacter baekdonensis]EKE68828.1 hypothetical protein B30_17455 [Celeribacter baekdonensis B30]